MEKIHSAISNKFHLHKYKLFNSYVFEWESDFFSVTNDERYIYEVEVKLSRADFLADFQKKEKHLWLSSAMKKIEVVEKTANFTNDVTMLFNVNVLEHTPNRFYYCCPEGMLKPEEIPDYAGLLYLNKEKTYVRQVKKAPFIHKKNNIDKYVKKLTDKFYFQFINMRKEIHWARHLSKDYESLQKKNSWLSNFVELHKNEGLMAEIDRLKNELNIVDIENHKLKRENMVLTEKLKDLELTGKNIEIKKTDELFLKTKNNKPNVDNQQR